MDKKLLDSYRPNKRLLIRLKEKIEEEECRDIPIVQGKVMGSMHDHPYIKRSFSVEMPETVEDGRHKKKIRELKEQELKVDDEIKQVEDFIAGIEDLRDQEIFKLYYTEGEKRMSQSEIANVVSCERSNVSKVISKYL